jgi:hypothetical protein
LSPPPNPQQAHSSRTAALEVNLDAISCIESSIPSCARVICSGVCAGLSG